MSARSAVVAFALLFAASCRKGEEPAASRGDGERAAGSGGNARPAPLGDTSFRFPAAARIVAVGDLHGDVSAARAALALAGAIDGTGRWIGGNLVVVQTGDQLDRGDDEPEILDLFERLRAEAKAAGGAFHALNGNHEVMNVQGDFRYVTEDGFRDWSAVHADGARTRLALELPAERRGRAAAFLPGGEAARRLAVQPVVLQVGDNVFVHGGVLERHLHYGLGRINREVEQWMQGEPGTPPPRGVAGDSAPIWSRDYSDGIPFAERCRELERVLERLSARRMVVGHTVQKAGINSACAGKVWRIDVGLARYYGGKPAVLEIRGDALRVLDGAAGATR